MNDMTIKLLKGALFSFQIGIGARLKNSLSASGVIGAILVGTTYYAFGGPVFYETLIAFFTTGSILSHHRKKEKELLPVEFEKGGERDIFQVLANGGMGALNVLLHHLSNGDPLFLCAFLGAIATVTADTWATEIGVLSKDDPRHILSGMRVPKGTSGGVSPLGNCAVLAGSLLPGMIAAYRIRKAIPSWVLLGSSLTGGVTGAFSDSILGATVQAQYFCPDCRAFTEKKIHRCGRSTIYQRGLLWFNNDMVNFASSLLGSLMGGLFYRLTRGIGNERETP